MHHLRNVRARTTFIDDSHIGIVKQFGDGAGTHNAADVRGNHNRVFQTNLQHIFQQDWAAENVINRDVKEALDLLGVKIDRQNAIDANAGKEIRDHFSGNRYASGAHAAVLTGIAEIGNNRGNTTSRSSTQRVDHHNQFHQIIIGGSTGGLDDENITTAYIFINLYTHFAIAETAHCGVSEAGVKAVGNTLC